MMPMLPAPRWMARAETALRRWRTSRMAQSLRAARADGVGRVVLGPEQQRDVRAFDRRTVGKRRTAAQASGKVDGQKRFADAGVAVEQGELAARQERRPQPANRLGADFGEGLSI